MRRKNNRQMDTLLSVAVTVGFIAAWLVSLTPIRALRSLRGPNDDATYGLLLPKSTI